MLIAIDIGTSALRTAAVTPDGRVLACALEPLSFSEPFPGWAELDPEDWWRALCKTTGKVLEDLSDKHLPLGLCVCGVTRTQVLIDAGGSVLRPAMLFRDRRAESDARVVAAALPQSNPAETISAFHPFARLAWLARKEPEIYSRIDAVLDPKDWLIHRLTDTLTADAVTLSRLDAFASSGQLVSGELSRIGSLIDRPRLWPWQEAGRITETAAPFDRLRGLPVFSGSMDAWATAVGAGALLPGQAYDVAGTSEAVGLLSTVRKGVDGLVSVLWGESLWQLGGPTQIGADSATWAHEVFRVKGRLSTAIERAGHRPPADDLPVFLPWLSGERTPVWRSDVRGMFAGLSRGNDGDALLWSVLEGVAHALRDILEIAGRETGERITELRVCGGGAQSDAWCQIKADVTGVPVVRTAAKETGLIGAAMCAAVGCGLHATLPAAAQAMCRTDAVFEPRAPLAALFGRRARIYQDLKRMALSLPETPLELNLVPLRDGVGEADAGRLATKPGKR
ncbi:FGGY-family carbohydrate kinase [Pararhodobacter sp. SW119]|uniref:xylulokinase n=1 Tax=Pararhodobacter sp. SW119 TaxID=2780075 RepID=UPI0032AED6DA